MVDRPIRSDAASLQLLILRKQVSERGERECEVLDTTQRVIAFF